MSGNHILSKQWTMFWWNCAFVNLLYSWSVKDDQKKWRILLMMLQFKLKCIPDFLSEAYLQPLIIHFLNNTKILVIFLKWQHSNFWKSICVVNLISNKSAWYIWIDAKPVRYANFQKNELHFWMKKRYIFEWMIFLIE